MDTTTSRTLQRNATGGRHGDLIAADNNTQTLKDPITGANVQFDWRCLDTVRSVEAKEGDPRVYFPRTVVGSSTGNDFFDVYGADDASKGYFSSWPLAHNLSSCSWYRHRRDVAREPNFTNDARNYGVLAKNALYNPVTSNGAQFPGSQYPELPLKWKTTGVMIGSGATALPGDWDMSIPCEKDGPFINKADDGTKAWKTTSTPNLPPYFNNVAGVEGAALSSPNRILSSPGMFGSLPTGVWAGVAGTAWQTLLFCKHPAAGAAHPGFTTPPDHLLLDLFAMPVVQPYAVSEPLSCAGRINMNSQIVPFTYLKRDTGLRALLKSVRIAALPVADADGYKGGPTTVLQLSGNRHFPVNMDETLAQWDSRFAANQPFRSPSEICDMYLVPQGQTLANMATYWTNNTLTGDNEREKPYSDLYPRLTTKSNTYNVHVRVQTLKAQARKVGFDPQKDFTVTGEYRGSSVIERYIDPKDPALQGVDFATLPLSDDNGVLDNYYKFRIVSTKRFAP